MAGTWGAQVSDTPETNRADRHLRPDAPASLHTHIDERDPFFSDGNNSSTPAGTHHAPAGASPATISYSLSALASRTRWLQWPDDEGGPPSTLVGSY